MQHGWHKIIRTLDKRNLRRNFGVYILASLARIEALLTVVKLTLFMMTWQILASIFYLKFLYFYIFSSYTTMI